MIFFIYGIMLTPRDATRWSLGTLVLPGVLVAVPVAVLMSVAWQGLAAALKPAAPVTSAPTTDAIGTALLMRDQYLIPFELSSLVLLAALVGSVYLARRRKGG